MNRSIVSINIASEQVKRGKLRQAEKSLLSTIELCTRAGDQIHKALAQMYLIQVEACRGRFKEARKNADDCIKAFAKAGLKSRECICWAFLAFRMLLSKSSEKAIHYAGTARRLADVEGHERDIIRSEWLLGWAKITTLPAQAETHLHDALTRCRRINAVDIEPDILLGWSRWHASHENYSQAQKDAKTALAIAERCEYRLVQADAHNLLARFATRNGDERQAKLHAQAAKEGALCDDVAYSYQPALDESERLLKGLANTKRTGASSR